MQKKVQSVQKTSGEWADYFPMSLTKPLLLQQFTSLFKTFETCGNEVQGLPSWLSPAARFAFVEQLCAEDVGLVRAAKEFLSRSES